MWNFWTYLRINGNGNGRKHGKKPKQNKTKQKKTNKQKKQTDRLPDRIFTFLLEEGTKKQVSGTELIPRFRNLKTRWWLRKYVIPETDICQKHVKKFSGSVVNVATETWKTVNKCIR